MMPQRDCGNENEDEERSMKRYRITLDDREFDVKVLDDPRMAQVRVEVDGEIVTVGVGLLPPLAEGGVEELPLSAPSPAAPVLRPDGVTTATAETARTVVAPLPGVIKSIAVRSGQSVAPDDELVVIEAMKMDNVIRATRTGRVGTIHVAEGRQVAYGEPLLEIDDER
jgi:biotin carboxyl carrier protein